jgi:hypothetical protein
MLKPNRKADGASKIQLLLVALLSRCSVSPEGSGTAVTEGVEESISSREGSFANKTKFVTLNTNLIIIVKDFVKQAVKFKL